jgi:hypothetical protein
MLEWPAETHEGTAVEAISQVTAFDRDGVPFAYGTCRRTMRVLGFKSVEADGQSFADVVRMEADTELGFGWLATIQIHETAWFARGVGLVRREERFNGRAFWLFRFQGAGRYELADEVTARMAVVADEVTRNDKSRNGKKSENRSNGANSEAGNGGREAPVANQDRWSRLAICFERTGRRIRLSGLAVEWAELNGTPAADSSQR